LLFRAVAISAITTVAILVSATHPVLAASAPQLHGRAAVLLDGVSGQVLYAENATDRNYPASTTKLLTALVALEYGDLDQMITVTPEAVEVPPDSSTCWLEAGEQHSLENLLYGLLLPSGNDCANAIAEGLTGGQPETFVAWMNEMARRLGATGTHFTNPHGYHDPNHYTTAMDLALISRAALQNPVILRISGTREYYWPGKSEINGMYLNNNDMLWLDPTTVGGKTGYTEEAGRTLVNAARRDGRLLIGVLMGEQNRDQLYQDMMNLLDYGFTQFTQQDLLTPGTYPDKVAVVDGEAEEVAVAPATRFPISVPTDGETDVTVSFEVPEQVTAPVHKGQTIGHAHVWQGDRLLAAIPLIAQADVAAKPVIVRMGRQVWSFTGELLKWAASAFALLVVTGFAVRQIRGAARPHRAAGPSFRRRSSRVGTISSFPPRSPGR